MRPSSPTFPLFLLRTRSTAAHLSSHSSAPMPPHQRTSAPLHLERCAHPPYFSLISAEEPSHRSAPPRHFIYSDAPIPLVFSLFLLRNRPTAAHLRAILSIAVLPSSPTFPLLLSSNAPTAAQLCPLTWARTAPHLRTFVLVSTMGTERFSHTNKSLFPCCPRGCTEVSEKSL